MTSSSTSPLTEPLLRSADEADSRSNGPGDLLSLDGCSRLDLCDDDRPAGPTPTIGGDACQETRAEAPLSRNINITLAYTFIAFAGRSLWSQSILAAFVFILCSDNPEFVGLVTGIMGLAQLLASFPSGILADRYRRDTTLRAASIVGVVAVISTALASWVENFVLLGCALASWGCYWGMSETSISALFADSITDGDRSHFFTKRMVLTKLGSMSGPLVALVMFALLGDEWSAKDCAIVMAVGQALCLPAVILLCFLSDDFTVAKHEISDLACDSLEPSLRNALESEGSSLDATQASSSETFGALCSSGHVDESETESAFPTIASLEENERRPFLCIPEQRVVPVFVAVADFSAGLAAGMSIRYFPIFFLNSLKLSPVMMQVLYAISPLGQAILSKIAELGAGKIGRPQMVVAFRWTGISFMLTMIVGYTHGLPVPLICILFLLRDSFMNSTSALNRSLLMDSVPKKERGKWSALESVYMFSWSGSAALGGILVGKEGLIFNFYVTATLQFIASLPLVMLFKRVKREKEQQSTQV